jgi:hypothetical protein
MRDRAGSGDPAQRRPGRRRGWPERRAQQWPPSRSAARPACGLHLARTTGPLGAVSTFTSDQAGLRPGPHRRDRQDAGLDGPPGARPPRPQPPRLPGPPTRAPIRRMEMSRPGELVHVDIKKLGRIPKGGGWRVHGRVARPNDSSAKRARIGYAYVHSRRRRLQPRWPTARSSATSRAPPRRRSGSGPTPSWPVSSNGTENRI